MIQTVTVSLQCSVVVPPSPFYLILLFVIITLTDRFSTQTWWTINSPRYDREGNSDIIHKEMVEMYWKQKGKQNRTNKQTKPDSFLRMIQTKRHLHVDSAPSVNARVASNTHWSLGLHIGGLCLGGVKKKKKVISICQAICLNDIWRLITIGGS